MSKPILLAVALSLAVAAPRAQAPDFSKSANPELVGNLAKELGATPQQAEGAAGALFDVAKSRLSPGDWGKVSGAVPGMDGLLKAAPALGAASMLSKAGGLGNATAAFQKLGLKPEMVMKAIPILTQYVTKSGGAGVGALLGGVLK